MHVEDLLQTLGHAAIMHFNRTSRELSTNSAEPKIGPRGRAKNQQKPSCLHILNVWKQNQNCSSAFWTNYLTMYSGCPTGTPKIFRPSFDGGNEKSPLHTKASGFTFCATAPKASATPNFRPSAFHSFVFSKWMLMPTFVRNASSNDSYTAPTLRGAHDVDVVKKRRTIFPLHANQPAPEPMLGVARH